MRLIWNESKRAANIEKHGIDFAEAETFDWSTAVVVADTRQDYGELRFLAFGMIGQRLYSLVYTRRAGDVRVISLRKANKRERTRYEKTKSAGP